MKITRFFAGTALLAAFLSMTSSPTAQAQAKSIPASREQLLKKVNPAIVKSLSAGTSQDVLVGLDATPENLAISQKYKPLVEQNIESGGQRLTDEQEKNRSEDERVAFKKIKDSLFEGGRNARIVVIQDFTPSPLLRVRIDDMDALLELVADTRVLRVSLPGHFKRTGTNYPNLIGQPAVLPAETRAIEWNG